MDDIVSLIILHPRDIFPSYSLLFQSGKNVAFSFLDPVQTEWNRLEPLQATLELILNF